MTDIECEELPLIKMLLPLQNPLTQTSALTAPSSNEIPTNTPTPNRDSTLSAYLTATPTGPTSTPGLFLIQGPTSTPTPTLTATFTPTIPFDPIGTVDTGIDNYQLYVPPDIAQAIPALAPIAWVDNFMAYAKFTKDQISDFPPYSELTTGEKIYQPIYNFIVILYLFTLIP